MHCSEESFIQNNSSCESMGITNAGHPKEGTTLHAVSHAEAGLQTSGKIK